MTTYVDMQLDLSPLTEPEYEPTATIQERYEQWRDANPWILPTLARLLDDWSLDDAGKVRVPRASLSAPSSRSGFPSPVLWPASADMSTTAGSSTATRRLSGTSARTLGASASPSDASTPPPPTSRARE